MPVTPFHVAPGLVLKAAAPRAFSVGVFTVVQFAIDVESVVNIARGRLPLHGPLHTLAGSLLVAAAVLWPARVGVTWLSPRLRSHLVVPPGVGRWIEREACAVRWPAAIAGALAGALSHVWLDAVIHHDVRPFAPLSDANPWFVAGSFTLVHVACAAIAVLGTLAWGVRRMRTS